MIKQKKEYTVTTISSSYEVDMEDANDIKITYRNDDTLTGYEVFNISIDKIDSWIELLQSIKKLTK